MPTWVDVSVADATWVSTTDLAGSFYGGAFDEAAFDAVDDHTWTDVTVAPATWTEV